MRLRLFAEDESKAWLDTLSSQIGKLFPGLQKMETLPYPVTQVGGKWQNIYPWRVFFDIAFGSLDTYPRWVEMRLNTDTGIAEKTSSVAQDGSWDVFRCIQYGHVVII